MYGVNIIDKEMNIFQRSQNTKSLGKERKQERKSYENSEQSNCIQACIFSNDKQIVETIHCHFKITIHNLFIKLN